MIISVPEIANVTVTAGYGGLQFWTDGAYDASTVYILIDMRSAALAF